MQADKVREADAQRLSLLQGAQEAAAHQLHAQAGAAQAP